MTKTVLGIGNALVDVLTPIDNDNIIDQLGLQKGAMQMVDYNTYIQISEFLSKFDNAKAPGGSAANTIHSLAKMGIDTSFIFATGNDVYGSFFEESMKSVGVETLAFHFEESVSGVVNAIISNDGERTFATFLGASNEMPANVLDLKMFEGFKYCYLEGYLIASKEVFLKAIDLARHSGCQIAFDMSSYNVVKANRDVIDSLLPQFDIVFANEDEATSFISTSPEESLDYIASKCKVAVVKLGKKGSIIKCGGEKTFIPTNSSIKALDSTGAGDLYAAGFLYGMINDLSLEKCGQIGTLFAENVIQVLGAKMDDARWKLIKAKTKEIILS